MKKEDFEKLMKEYAIELKISLTDEQIEKFYTYMELLLEWNEKINLTAITKPEEIVLKHFIDSMTIAQYISQGAKVVDVGTGAGFPGIPLKIIRDDLEVTLLDSLNKRVNFLNEVIDRLQLTKMSAVHSRVEEFGRNKNYREKFDVATSRAVANLSTLAEYQIPLVKLDGVCVSMKGSDVEDELASSENAIILLGGKVEKVDQFQLPKSDMNRSVVVIRKCKSTPAKFPRKPGVPSKEPLF